MDLPTSPLGTQKNWTTEFCHIRVFCCGSCLIGNVPSIYTFQGHLLPCSDLNCAFQTFCQPCTNVFLDPCLANQLSARNSCLLNSCTLDAFTFSESGKFQTSIFPLEGPVESYKQQLHNLAALGVLPGTCEHDKLFGRPLPSLSCGKPWEGSNETGVESRALGVNIDPTKWIVVKPSHGMFATISIDPSP